MRQLLISGYRNENAKVLPYHFTQGHALTPTPVIRVFGVFSHTQLNRLWESLSYQLAASGGQEYRARCCKRVWNRDGTRIMPAVFPPNGSVGQDPLPIPELPKDDLQEVCDPRKLNDHPVNQAQCSPDPFHFGVRHPQKIPSHLPILLFFLLQPREVCWVHPGTTQQ